MRPNRTKDLLSRGELALGTGFGQLRSPEIPKLLAAGGFGAGVFGSLLGLGGGILIVPLLTVGFGLSFREAVGVSLVCVIVTSSAAASKSASCTRSSNGS